MKRKIVGFHQDEEHHWVADLECGHQQHVRHDPPLTRRLWVLTAEGRKSRIGGELDCKKCDELRLGGASHQASLTEQRIKAADDWAVSSSPVWAKTNNCAGHLAFTVDDDDGRERVQTEGAKGVSVGVAEHRQAQL